MNALASPSRYQLATDQANAYLHRGGEARLAPEGVRWMVEGMLVMTPNDLDILTCWLAGREQDIAQGREGLGILQSVFRSVIGRDAQV